MDPRISFLLSLVTNWVKDFPDKENTVKMLRGYNSILHLTSMRNKKRDPAEDNSQGFRTLSVLKKKTHKKL